MTPKPSRPANRAGRQHAQAQALRALQQQAATTPAQAYDWAQDPIWATPIPEPPDWDHLDDHQQHVYKLAAIAYAIRAISDTRGVSAARQLADWEII